LPLLKLYKGQMSVESLWMMALASTFLFAIFSYHFVEVAAYTKTRSLALRWFKYFSAWISGKKTTVSS